jgi:hypothetical protein
MLQKIQYVGVGELTATLYSIKKGRMSVKIIFFRDFLINLAKNFTPCFGITFRQKDDH